VTRGGIFLPSRTPRPVGEAVSFEVQLAGGQVALSGAGKVMWIKEFDPAQPQRPHGMGVQFVRIDPASRETLNRMLKAKAAAPARPTTGPVQPLHARGTNGSAGRQPRIDAAVDLVSEYGLDEAALRRTVDRYRFGSGGRPVEDELGDLLKPEPAELPSLAQALSELPRLLDPGARRRTGAFRPLEAPGERQQPPGETKPPKSGPDDEDPS
jgi:molecular chaperone DnaK